MHIAIRRLAAGSLKIGINILSVFDGPNRQRTLAEESRRKYPAFRWWKHPPIKYRVQKEDFARIFHMKSSLYQDEPSEDVGEKRIGRAVRYLAGYNDVVGGLSMMTQHGFGNTRTMRADRSMNIYVNELRSGHGLNFVAAALNTLRNLPKALIHAKTFNALFSKAAHHEQPGRVCELAIVARRPILHPDRKQVIFVLRADFNDSETDRHVVLRDIFRPVANAEGQITGTTRINPKSKTANIEALRALILFKVIADQTAENKVTDVAEAIRAVDALPLTDKSTLKDYLMFRP